MTGVPTGPNGGGTPREITWPELAWNSSTQWSESISYTLGKGQWNICVHSKNSVAPTANTVNLRIYQSNYYALPHQRSWQDWDSIPVHAFINSVVPNEFLSYDTLSPEVDEYALASDGVAAVWPQVEQQMGESAINFAIDARKLPRLAKQAHQAYLKVRWLVSDVAKHRSLSIYNLEVLIKSLSESKLVYEYVLKTTYDDLQTLSSAVRKARNELKRLQKGASRIHHRAHTTTLREYKESQEQFHSTPWQWPQSYPAYNGDRKLHRKISYPNARFTTHVWFSYELPDMSPRLAEAAAILDMLGVNLNPRIAWDALKYSFCVDWLIRVGEFLNQFKLPWVKPVVKVYRCWTVLHLEKRTEVLLEKTGGYHTYDPLTAIPPTVIATGSCELFVRKPSTYGFQTLKTSGLSKHEIVMAASLFGARLKP
jgi:hypothetical protein